VLINELEAGGQNNTNSKAEELLTKLRFLKYKHLINKNEDMRKRIKEKRGSKYSINNMKAIIKCSKIGWAQLSKHGLISNAPGSTK